jgi:hypothetical protein
MPGPTPSIQGLVARLLADALTPEDQEDGEDNSLLSWSVWHANSSAIQTVKHRLRDGMMTVRFTNREMYPDYLFMDVPRELFRQWKRVKSAGKFYHRRIKGQYSIT